MRVTPLSDYFVLMGISPDFKDTSTACWRCYVGKWEITLDRLYLIGIRAAYKDGTEVTLGSLFPGYDSRVFAHWYSGVLSIPQGDLVEYVHMFESVGPNAFRKQLIWGYAVCKWDRVEQFMIAVWRR
jgi:hypothetical protein